MNMFVTGMTGSGKSYFIRDTLLRIKMPIIIISIKKSDIDNFSNDVKDLSGRKVAITNENFQNITKLQNLGTTDIGFYMDFISPENQIKFMDNLALMLRTKQNIVLYIDECHNFIGQSGQYSKNLISLISMAREQNIHIVLATQRPQEVQKSALNNCKYKVSFLLSETNAVKAMSKIFEDVSEEEIKNLPMYKFIIQNAYDKSTQKNIKI
ncbi:MAG: AAA family ATPase [Arcobacter sp.]|nr:AAA family ATPase [Arcobacter sp.]